MKNGRIISGIDIGTNSVKVVVVQVTPDGALEVLGVGSSPVEGMRHGYVIDAPKVVRGVQRALDDVVKSAKLRPSQAYLSIGGESLGTVTAPGVVYVTSPDAVISSADVQKVITNASTKSDSALVNQKTLHEIPLGFRIDGTVALSNPEGMRGSKLESDILFVHALERHIDDFISVVESAGIEVLDVTAAPLAASFASLSLPQKMQGCILVDIGAESTDVVVFEGNTPRMLTVLPIGSTDITNKLAVELKISPLDAEKLKRTPHHATERKAVEKALDHALTDIFSEVKRVAAEVRKSNILPAGVLITGGGSHAQNITEVAKRVLGLPARTVRATTPGVDHSPELTVAYGLCIWGAQNEPDDSLSSVKGFFTNVFGWFRQFLP